MNNSLVLSIRQITRSGASVADYLDLNGADLRWADLSGANLSLAKLHGAKLFGANLENAIR